MDAAERKYMTADEFLVWAMEQPTGRYELVDGEVVAMAPERVAHARCKLDAAIALHAAVRTDGRGCEVFSDGMAVRIDETTMYEPDAALRCGDPLDGDDTFYSDPVVIVEVLLPSTRGVDTGTKLEGYFRLDSLRHYLIVNPKRKSIVHHRRDGAAIATTILHEGRLRLDPPGLDVPVAAFFESL